MITDEENFLLLRLSTKYIFLLIILQYIHFSEIMNAGEKIFLHSSVVTVFNLQCIK